MILIRLFLIGILLMAVSPLGYAADEPVIDLSRHGQELEKITFDMRYDFEKKNEKKWEKATFEERQAYLNAWYTQKDLDAKAALLKTKEELKEERIQRMNARREEMQAKRQAQEEAKKLKAELKAKKNIQKSFEQKNKEQKRTLDRLRSNQQSSRIR